MTLEFFIDKSEWKSKWNDWLTHLIVSVGNCAHPICLSLSEAPQGMEYVNIYTILQINALLASGYRTLTNNICQYSMLSYTCVMPINSVKQCYSDKFVTTTDKFIYWSPIRWYGKHGAFSTHIHRRNRQLRVARTSTGNVIEIIVIFQFHISVDSRCHYWIACKRTKVSSQSLTDYNYNARCE